MIQYESSLENAFVRHLEFEDAIRLSQDQPLVINYKERRYTPDFLVFFNNSIRRYRKLKPTLFEIKTIEDFSRATPRAEEEAHQAVDTHN